jgi:hypothetical protein
LNAAVAAMQPITLETRNAPTQVRVRLEPASGLALLYITPDALCPECGERSGIFVAAGRGCSPCVRCHLAAERSIRDSRTSYFTACGHPSSDALVLLGQMAADLMAEKPEALKC